jgi:hypothetical protein
MSFHSTTKAYLKEFQRIAKNALSTGVNSIELATRPVVHNYITAVVDHCQAQGVSLVIHHDTNYNFKDRPDWRIEDASSFGVFCFGDHKNLNATSQFQLTTSEETQINRYLALGRPVFVFDGIEFLFFKDTLSNVDRCSLLRKPLSFDANWGSQQVDLSVETYFRNILQNPGFRKWTESHLIQQLAKRARLVSDEMASLLMAPLGSGSSNAEEDLLRALHSLRNMIAAHHDPSLRNEKACADFIAQVLTFGLFYAHTRQTKISGDPTSKQEAITSFWTSESIAAQPNLLRPFKTIISALSVPLTGKNVLSDWYREILSVLGHAEYMGTEPGPLDFHSLFEEFLKTFDEQSRFDRGAFFTPKILANWIARFSDLISRERFKLPILEAADKIIDPCCGTGSFLEAVYSLRTGDTVNKPSLIGFEILPAPYALAHYRMAELFDGNTPQPQLNIVLTDTLSDQLRGPVGDACNGFEGELNDAIKLSNSSIRLVIGNPPSAICTVSCAPRSIIESKLSAFRPPISERTDRQNIQKALRNEAYRFLRWCADKVIESGRGIVAIVLPGAFARSVSFKYARKWLIENFQEIYVLEVDGDARKNDSTQSVFAVLQGRMVVFAVKSEDIRSSETIVYHHDITNLSLNDKQAFLSLKPSLDSFTVVQPSPLQSSFARTAGYPIALWTKCWPLTSTSLNVGIFFQKCSGVKLAPTSILFHTQKQILVRRSLDLSKTKEPAEQLISRWFGGQAKPPKKTKLTPGVKASLKVSVTNEDISDYLYRPFVHGKVLNSNQLFAALKDTEGSGARDRPEIRAAFNANAIGIAIAPAPSDIGNTLCRFACFAWTIPDNDIASRGNAMIYCDQFPQRNNDDTSVLADNVCGGLIALFAFSDSPAKAVVFYTYAVISCPTYLDVFEGILYSPSDPSNPPRIPIASCERTRRMLVEIGRSIAECEREDYMSKPSASISFKWPEDFNEFNFVKWSYDEDTQEVSLKGDGGETVLVSGVSPVAESLKIAGHLVIEKWLRERKRPYLGRKFTIADLHQFINLISAICDQAALIDNADKHVATMLSAEDLIDAPRVE